LNRLQYFFLFVAYRFTVKSRRRLHRQIREHLKKMILNHIANGASLVVETSPTLDTEIFGHRDLDALDVVAIPKRLDKRVRKAKDHEVIHRPLSKVVVDAKNIFFSKRTKQNLIQLTRGFEVVPKRLFDNYATVLAAT